MATIVRHNSFTDTTVLPLSVWVPPNGLRAEVGSVFLAVATATIADLDLIVEINTDEGWKQLAILFLGQGDWRYSNVFASYSDPVFSSQSNGTDPVVRISTVLGTPDLKFRGFVSATGEENP